MNQYCYTVTTGADDVADVDALKKHVSNIYRKKKFQDAAFGADEDLPFLVVWAQQEKQVCVRMTSKAKKNIERVETIHAKLKPIDLKVAAGGVTLSKPELTSEAQCALWDIDCKLKGGQKWSTLEHVGPYFTHIMEPYEPHKVPVLYGKKKYVLTPQEERIATFYARQIAREKSGNVTQLWSKDTVFNKNFWNDFKGYLSPEHAKIFKDFDQFDFTPISDYLEETKEEAKQATQTEKTAKKIKTAERKLLYGYAIINGVKEPVGNFTIEPAAIFYGRGDNPKRGKIKRDIEPEEVTINIGKDAEIPDPPEGHAWKAIIHDQSKSWLASWKDAISGENKYVFFAAAGQLKGKSDLLKYEKARKLNKYLDKIVERYTADITSDSNRMRQLGTVLYLIDNYGIRIGNEKDETETDTVGASTLRVEHVKLATSNKVIFDFLGKDSVRYYAELVVPDAVYKNFQAFIKNKKPSDSVFDLISAPDINAYLKTFDKDFSAKVFRTRLASTVMDSALKATTVKKNATLAEKKKLFLKANIEVAKLLNHQRTVSIKAQETVGKYKQELKDLEKQSKTAKKAGKSTTALDNKITKKKDQIASKEDTLNIAVTTSLTNYIDPRIVVSWSKSNDLIDDDNNPQVYTTALQRKFKWAIDMTEDDWDYTETELHPELVELQPVAAVLVKKPGKEAAAKKAPVAPKKAPVLTPKKAPVLAPKKTTGAAKKAPFVVPKKAQPQGDYVVPTVMCLSKKQQELGFSLEKAPNVVYIGRAWNIGKWKLAKSKWFNPFPMKNDTRENVLKKYKEYLLAPEQAHLIADLPELSGKVLGCWCHPEPCHGDVLVELFEEHVMGKSTAHEEEISEEVSEEAPEVAVAEELQLPAVTCLTGSIKKGKVLVKRQVEWGASLEKAPDNVVYIGGAKKTDGWSLKKSKWSNPFPLKAGADPKKVLTKYKEYLYKQSHLLADLPELNGKILACWCHPDPCHGEVLIDLFEKHVVKGIPVEVPEEETEEIKILPFGVEIVDYSETGIAVIGNTAPLAAKLKKLGGTLVPNLIIAGKKTPGWLFIKTKRNIVEETIQVTMMVPKGTKSIEAEAVVESKGADGEAVGEAETGFDIQAILAGVEEAPEDVDIGGEGEPKGSVANVRVIDYTTKSIAVIGDTKPIKGQLMTLGGKFNKFLKVNGKPTPGWIFPKGKRSAIEKELGFGPTTEEPSFAEPPLVLLPVAEPQPIRVIDYTEKSIAVIGDTKPIKDKLLVLKGKFNKFLQVDGKTTPGWIFPKGKRNEVLAIALPDEAEAPVEAPVDIPVEIPVEVPVEAPVEAPVEVPVAVPVVAPEEVSVESTKEVIEEPEEVPEEEPETPLSRALKKEKNVIKCFSNDTNVVDYIRQNLNDTKIYSTKLLATFVHCLKNYDKPKATTTEESRTSLVEELLKNLQPGDPITFLFIIYIFHNTSSRHRHAFLEQLIRRVSNTAGIQACLCDNAKDSSLMTGDDIKDIPMDELYLLPSGRCVHIDDLVQHLKSSENKSQDPTFDKFKHAGETPDLTWSNGWELAGVMDKISGRPGGKEIMEQFKQVLEGVTNTIPEKTKAMIKDVYSLFYFPESENKNLLVKLLVKYGYPSGEGVGDALESVEIASSGMGNKLDEFRTLLGFKVGQHVLEELSPKEREAFFFAGEYIGLGKEAWGKLSVGEFCTKTFGTLLHRLSDLFENKGF